MSEGTEAFGFALIRLKTDLYLFLGETLLRKADIYGLLSSPGIERYTKGDTTEYYLGQLPAEYLRSKHPSISHKAPETTQAGVLQPIRLYENTKYKWQLLVRHGEALRAASAEEIDAKSVSSSMSRHESWDPQPETPNGTFESKNYLGVAWIGLGETIKARFEFVSRKLDYETQYISLLNYLTLKEVSLLYDFRSPTAAILARDKTKRSPHKLDNYLLLRAIVPPRILQGIVNQIISRPHSSLCTELSWKPASYANPSYALVHPSSRVRWATNSDGARTPDELLEARRHDSFDTVPNRFAKYALEFFLDICEATNELTGENAGALKAESMRMTESIRMLLGSTFFRRVGRLSYIPYDNQVLQKRDGYRQLFRAFLYASCGLRMPDVMEGALLSVTAENRNVPKLYEIWLFFFLAETLERMGGGQGLASYKDEIRRDKTTPTVDISKGDECKFSTNVNLDGQAYELRLFYNRTFKPSAPGGTGRSGLLRPREQSYSMELQPDFTLEAKAAGGETTFIHFDAKFRIKSARISKLSAKDGKTEDGVAQPDDVHKMHTYNDAIYGTAASVILYPGEIGKEGFDQYYRKFEELLPGVGALEVKPGDSDDIGRSKSALQEFIESCLRDIPPAKSIFSRVQSAASPTLPYPSGSL